MSLVLEERRGAVTIFTLNDPSTYNAMGSKMLPTLRAALAGAEADADVRAIILTGAGKGFCSGAHMSGGVFEGGARIGSVMRQSINPTIEAMRGMVKPIVVAMNGAAAGAGVGLALAGDIVIAARSARFVLSFARLGAALDGGASILVQTAIGAARARAMALLAEPLDAETAEQWGLIWKVVDDADLMTEALAIATKLADGPPVSLGLIKRQIEDARGPSIAETLEAETLAQATAFETEDLREGAAAFRDKRPPRFRGR